MKNVLTKSVILLAGSLILTSSLFAKEKVEVLTVHHFLGPNSPAQTKLLVPWARKIEKLSKGRIKIEIFPSMSMGGKPTELYKQVRNGSADIVWTVAGYTPGVFPRTEVYELPTVHKGSSLATSIAIRENFDLIKDDYKKVKVLLIHTHAGNALHMTTKRVRSIDDLKGMKLRTPSRVGAWLIEEYGAEPVGMPMPSFPQALAKKTIDGGFMPFEVFPSFKFHQLLEFSALGANGDRFGTSVFLLLMNKERFNSLDKELQNLIEESFNMDMVKKIGQIWMDIEKPGMEMQAASKNSEIARYSAKTMAEFNIAGQRVVDRWIKEVSKKGIDGAKLVKEARKAIARNTK